MTAAHALLPSSNRLVTGREEPRQDAFRLPPQKLLGEKKWLVLGIILARRYRPNGLQPASGKFYPGLPRPGRMTLKSGEKLEIDPIIVGRNGAKMESLAKSTTSSAGRPISMQPLPIRTTDLLRRRYDPDAGRTAFSGAGSRQACLFEKPISDDLQVALNLARKARGSGLKHGVVQDKLFPARSAQAGEKCCPRSARRWPRCQTWSL